MAPTYQLPFKGYSDKDDIMPLKSCPNSVEVLTNFTTSSTFTGISPSEVNVILTLKASTAKENHIT